MSDTLSRRRVLGGGASLAVAGVLGDVTPSFTTVRAVREPAHFVFVHGSWHGAWCWYRITAALEARGHRATAIDLPAAGIDATPPAGVTLQAQADRVIALLDTLTAPVVLVGHSAGGPVVSLVAEARAAKIAKLVYLTAYMLPSGASILSELPKDPASLVTTSLVVSPDGTIFLRPDAIRDLFYGKCDDADVALARSLLKPMGILPNAGAVRVGAAFASVRRFYIHCRHDRAISLEFQRALVAALPCERTYAIDADHSAFFSRPRALTRVLDAIARV